MRKKAIVTNHIDDAARAPVIPASKPTPSSHLRLQARDAFYKCVEGTGAPFEVGVVPKQCTQLRRAFEASCRSAWVKHFDLQRDKELRLLRTLRDNINHSAATATGGLADEVQH